MHAGFSSVSPRKADVPHWCISAKIGKTRGKRRYACRYGYEYCCHVGYNVSDGVKFICHLFFCRFSGNGTNGFICICHIYLARRVRGSLVSSFVSQCRGVYSRLVVPIKRDRHAWRSGKPRTATVRLAVQPSDYVNVAHGGATDASRRLSHLRSLLQRVGIRLHPNPPI